MIEYIYTTNSLQTKGLMMKLLLVYTLFPLLLLFAGCIESETVVSVKKDGSGTITLKVLISNELAKMANSFGASLSDDTVKGNSTDFTLIDEASLKSAAGKMGSGVTFVSAAPYSTETAEGYIATYTFKDINTIKIDQNPSDNVPSQPGHKKKAPTENLKFHFKKGKKSVLTIIQPQPESLQKESSSTGSTAKIAEEGDSEQKLQAINQMFGGMHIAIFVEVDGKITKTNADFVEGPRITLLNMSFDKLLANSEKLQAFAQSDQNSIEEVKELVKNVPGVKVETQKEVIIEFK